MRASKEELYHVDVLGLEDRRGQILLVERVILEDLRPGLPSR